MGRWSREFWEYIWDLRWWLIGIAWTIVVVSVGVSVGVLSDERAVFTEPTWAELILLIPSGVLGWIPAALMHYNWLEHTTGNTSIRIEKAREYIRRLEEYGERDDVCRDPRRNYRVPVVGMIFHAFAWFVVSSWGVQLLWVFLKVALKHIAHLT